MVPDPGKEPRSEDIEHVHMGGFLRLTASLWRARVGSREYIRRARQRLAVKRTGLSGSCQDGAGGSSPFHKKGVAGMGKIR